jgi:hypothetical protein
MERMTMAFGIWCVDQRLGGKPPRWAIRDGKTLTFETDKEAMAEARRFRADKRFAGKWIFFHFPIDRPSRRG